MLLSKFRNVVKLPKKHFGKFLLLKKKVQNPHTRARALDINCKTIDAIHLITGLGATLLPCSPEVSEVALVWRAILVALSL